MVWRAEPPVGCNTGTTAISLRALVPGISTLVVVRALRIVEVGKPLVEVDVAGLALGPGDVRIEVEAAGICRSDIHYRSGARPIPSTPLTPGHEIAGSIVEMGQAVASVSVGDRVAVHYLVSCGSCDACRAGLEPFCVAGEMVGLDRDGGYAETVIVPAPNAYRIPDTIPFEVAAIMMCSTSTSLHALRRARLAPGETVAVFGCGGLGISAIKLARALGAGKVVGVDVSPAKLAMAESLGARAVPFDEAGDIVADVALEMVGLAETMKAAVDSLAIRGRAVVVGIADESFAMNAFTDLALKEAEILGAVDHLGSEIAELIEMAAVGRLDLSDVVTGTVPLEVEAINEAMDRLEAFGGGVRTVIRPGG